MNDKELEAFKELQLRLQRSQRSLEELKRNTKLLIEGMRDYQAQVHRLLEDLRRAGAITY